MGSNPFHAESLEIIVIGDELLDGRTHEKNSHFLASACRSRGLRLTRVSFIGDEPEVIEKELHEASKRVGLIVTSGGLGPTLDDRTRAAIASASGSKLVVNAEVRERLGEKYRARDRVMSPSNLRQAQFPETATVLPSNVGTADAFEVPIGDATVVCLPGVPHEFKHLVTQYVLDRHTGTDPRRFRRFHLFGQGESYYADRLEALELPDSVKITYNAHFPVVDVELSGDANSSVLDDAALRVADELAPWIFEGNGRSPAEALVKTLDSSGLRIAGAESCTGGWLSNAIIDIPGASKVIGRSFVTYSNDAKMELLGVRETTLNEHGAVSEACAREMAEGVARVSRADLGVALSGIAGPSGGTEEKPVGTVYIAVATSDVVTVVHAQFNGVSRSRFKALAGTAALMLALRTLEGRVEAIDHVRGIVERFTSQREETSS